MAFIHTIPPSRATGPTAEAYGYMRRMGGTSEVGKIVQAFSLRPGSMRMMIRSWELSMWVGTQARRDRELLASAISRLNECSY